MLNEHRVVAIAQTVGLAASPQGVDKDAHLQWLGDPAKGPHRELRQPSGFDHRHQLLADSGRAGKIHLAPMLALAREHDQPPHRQVVHASIVGIGPYQVVTVGSYAGGPGEC